MTDYLPPVSELLTLGELQHDSWDYHRFHFGPEHTPALARMIADWSLHSADSDTPAVWAPLHAFRALSEFQPEAAVEALLQIHARLYDEWWDEWLSEDLIELGRRNGAPALPLLEAYLNNPDNGEARGYIASTIGEIGVKNQELRDRCVAALTAALEQFHDNDETTNGILIADLMQLQAREAAPVMERAFAAGAVEISVAGDWEDVQVELGLLKERITPRPQYHNLGFTAPAIVEGPSAPDRHKQRAKKKAQRQAKKKNRKKKKG